MKEETNGFGSGRSEQVHDIIERMPNKFGIWVTSIVLTLVLGLFIFGWIIRYPDTITGEITINTKYAPVKLVAASSGKLRILVPNAKQEVQEGQYIGIIQNPTNTADLIKVKKMLDEFSLENDEYMNAINNFPKQVSLGEINSRYYAFLNVLHKINSNEVGNSFRKQSEGIQAQISKLNIMLLNFKKLEKTREVNMALYKKISDRDSILLSKSGMVEAEADQSRISYLNSKAGYQSIMNDINNAEQRLEEYSNRLQLLFIQRQDEESKLRLDLLSAYDDVIDHITLWEQAYVLKSPMKGQVDFLKFWNNDEFVQQGEEIFRVIPKNNKIIGQVMLPSTGAGKVSIGQGVIIKLDNYPYLEFGSVKGRVVDISLTTNVSKHVGKADVNVYKIEVELPGELTTNYGVKLEFKSEIKGSAEIVTNDRNLLQRFFDNLKHATKK